MGLGPMNAIYQARFNHYLHDRGIKDTSDQHVWAFLGDGEMDEPESRGLLHVAALEGLDNLTFVVNCNLQRLDGPVRGNGKIIQELESFFRGAGWNVIKVVWGREWDALLHADRDGALVNLMNTTPDGDYQTYKANDGAYVRDHFFGRDPRTKALVEHMTDSEIWNLKRGGHDYRKVYAAYQRRRRAQGPADGDPGQDHQGLLAGRALPGPQRDPPDEKACAARPQRLPRRHPDPDQRRTTRAGPLPAAVLPPRPGRPGDPLSARPAPRTRRLPARAAHQVAGAHPAGPRHLRAAEEGVRQPGSRAPPWRWSACFKELLRDKEIGPRIVPIIPDEARTFGMDSWFPSLKIYNRNGQLYTAVDAELHAGLQGKRTGQILHEGINEAGSVASFTAVGTSYSTHNEPMIPIYIFYSMFGFQRTGDGLWAAADQMSRGFLLGATAGRTTLTGEGLQHADGHSPLLAATNPAVVSYDPAFAFEIAHIIESGLARMYGDNAENVFFYLTIYNEPYVQPPEPENFDPEGLLRGIYRYRPATEGRTNTADILASGVAMPSALRAAEMLAAEWDVAADVWSVTSWSELNRDGVAIQKEQLRHPDRPAGEAYVTKALSGSTGPFIAVSDWMRAVPEQIRPWVPGRFVTLGTDGFGFSDTRPAARRFFNTDAESQVVAVLEALARDGSRSTRRYRWRPPASTGSTTCRPRRRRLPTPARVPNSDYL